MQAKQVGRPKRHILVVRRAPGGVSRAILSFGGLAFRAAIGRSGTSVFKREGDGASPVADMQILSGYCRPDRMRGLKTCLRLKATGQDDLWCDEPGHAAYNRPVRAPFRPSHEEMRRADRLYDICLVLDWNVRSRKRYGGSAIFFHLAHDDYAPTAGCVALRPRDMQRILPFLRKGTVVRVLK